MRRREFVRAAGALATAVVTGCLHDGTRASDENVVWQHGVGGRVDAVGDGTVYGREDWRNGGKRGVFALKAEDGKNEWTYGDVGGYSSYTEVVVKDTGVYFGYGDDAVGSGAGELYALDTDGGERWVHDVGSVYEAPVVGDGVVYVGSDKGNAYAFGAESGDELWRFEGHEDVPEATVEGVSDGVVYVTADDALYALDAENGDEIWRHTPEGSRIATVVVAEDAVYFRESGDMVAYSDSDELWRHEFENTNAWIREVAHGNLYYRHGSELRALDADDGEDRWSTDVGESKGLATAFDDGTAYVGTIDLTGFSSEGDELWTAELDGSELSGISVGDDGNVYAVTGESVYLVEDGEVASSTEVPSEPYSHVVGEGGRVYVGGRGGVYGIEV